MQAPNSPPTPASSTALDSLTCSWGDCRHRCSSAETLYEHVCEKHVGRKSTNNLNLTCQWGSCRTTTVKRDHITSHIRVHVPLKPHKCDFCGKAFKRPQDLKKHVKTHADESVLLRSPEPSSANRVPVTNGYQQNGTSKHTGYMSDNTYNQNGGYNHYNAGHSHNFYTNGGGGGTSHNANFGPVYYHVPQTVSLAGGDESRKRGHDALNSFFGDVKRRHIDPNQYYDLGSRLGSVQSLSLPMFGNMPGMGDDHGGAAVAYNTATLPMPTYTTPFSELRTKNDLMSIDQFLQQLQETAYEYTGHTTATVIPQTQTAPPQQQQQQQQQPLRQAELSALHDPMPMDAHTPSSISTSSYADSITPALTPSSYTATYSPSSVHSHHVSVSPVARPTSGANLYPSLLPSLSDVTANSSTAPPPSLASPYEDFGSELRFGGAVLQRAQTRTSPPLRPAAIAAAAADAQQLAKGVGKMDLATPKPAEVGEFGAPAQPQLPQQRRSRGSSANSDASSGGQTTTEEDARQEAWVKNIYVIERLREFIAEKMRGVDAEHGDRASASPVAASATAAKTDRDGDAVMREAAPVMAPVRAEGLYPVLRR